MTKRGGVGKTPTEHGPDSLWFEIGQATAYAESVARGAKPCASVTIHQKNADAIAEHLVATELNVVFDVRPISAGWAELTIVCDRRLLKVLDTIATCDRQLLCELTLGLLFGYRAESVLDYLDRLEQFHPRTETIEAAADRLFCFDRPVNNG